MLLFVNEFLLNFCVYMTSCPLLSHVGSQAVQVRASAFQRGGGDVEGSAAS